jgi:hypothetical protein
MVAKPTVTITGGPDDFTWFRRPEFTFTGSSGATFRCRLDSDAFVPCTSPWLAPDRTGGAHTFEVKSVSAEGAESDVARRSYAIEEPSTTRVHCEFKPFVPEQLPGRSGKVGCIASTSYPGAPRGPYCERSSQVFDCKPFRDSCPVGARCDLSMTAVLKEDDPEVNWDPDVTVLAFPPSDPFKSTGFFNYKACRSPQGDTGCTARTSGTRLGADDGLALSCGADVFAKTLRDPYPSELGPDSARSLVCDGSIKVTPAEGLGAVAQGGSVSIYSPGSGLVGVGPAGGGGKVAPAKGKPTFKAVNLSAAGPGPVTFKPKLSKAAKKTLKKKHTLKLKLAVTYTPEGGGEATSKTATVKLTTVKKPKGPRP